jgi:hypothetical protein
MDRLRSETQPLQISRCGRPQEIIIKLQKRVQVGEAGGVPWKQLFSKTNRRCFDADIADDEQNIETRDVETVKLAEHDETRHLWLCWTTKRLWETNDTRRTNPINRTIYRLKVGQHTRSTTWTNTVRNRFRQIGGEIQVFRELEIGEAKWCKEHIPHKGNDLNDITEEGISLSDDTELWWEKQDLLWACHISRQKDRILTDPFGYTKAGQFQQPLQVTGIYTRARVETRWGSDWRKQQSDLKIRGGCSKWIHTVSRRTTGDTRSRNRKSRISVTSANLCG